MLQVPARIGGRPVSAAEWIEVRSPWDGAPVGRVPALTGAHIAEACEAAAKVLARRDFPQHARAEVLARAAEMLTERVEEFAVTVARESGKPIADARAEAARCADTLRFSAVEARKLAGELVPMDASRGGLGRLGLAIRHPAGVVAAITPFNFPLNLVAHKLGPAIAAGCPVVLKPAELTPISAIRLVDLLVEAGLPGDWISVVTGTGPETGTPLVEHPVPAVVSFTGSVPVGRRIQRTAAGKRVLLELGSNAPVLIEPGADLQRAVAAIRRGGFAYAGQVCISTQRVLAHRSVYDRVLELLREAVSTLRLGDPLDERTEVGPLISAAATDRVVDWLDTARAAGASVTGGERNGPLLAPAVVADPPRHLDVYRQEVFGPVVTVTPYAGIDEGIALANDSDYRLQAGIFTPDLAVALRAASELDFGGVLVNDVPTFRADQQPYGGVGDAGNTREGPAYAINEMTELRFVSVSA
ncbi:aldehyde dehydrogenase family protein [Actinoplanes regularis]|uniref:Acyl-CoA reductase n=1 Tax=Actinoplanes regularis TaxID=52697 RepID=A0A239E7M3_9ACTN|nr:aldehyde dehydrogenase family protein [Actinoplanes regularis]GIE89284.1 aldehyde dehydrogenase [Actinoplanes regularis]GLW34423.1 aldehyde dehydrogenase [Actinoplanes regularis]SNS40288.1 Acyl-CoA reductase [Actinoplanes regularis]